MPYPSFGMIYHILRRLPFKESEHSLWYYLYVGNCNEHMKPPGQSHLISGVMIEWRVKMEDERMEERDNKPWKRFLHKVKVLSVSQVISHVIE